MTTPKYPIIRVRAKSHQVETFYKLGGAKWLRDQLDQQHENPTPKEKTSATFTTPDQVWTIHLIKESEK